VNQTTTGGNGVYATRHPSNPTHGQSRNKTMLRYFGHMLLLYLKIIILL